MLISPVKMAGADPQTPQIFIGTWPYQITRGYMGVRSNETGDGICKKKLIDNYQ